MPGGGQGVGCAQGAQPTSPLYAHSERRNTPKKEKKTAQAREKGGRGRGRVKECFVGAAAHRTPAQKKGLRCGEGRAGGGGRGVFNAV